MSPNEQHLRAALRQGEGDRPDAGRIIHAARERRRSRRRAAGAVLGSVAAVLAVGGIAVAALRSGGSDKSSAGGGGGGSAPTSAAAGAATQAPQAPQAPQATNAPDSSPLVCPVALPSITPSPASTGELLPDGIVRVRICLYQTGTETVAGTSELSGAEATQFAASLENSPPLKATTLCTTDLGPEVVIIAQTETGRPVTLRGNLGGCGAISNGPATRLARSLLQTQLHSLLPRLSVPGHATAGPGPS